MARLTPMMEQYLATKAQVPDALLFFRLGDFYELFMEDAVTAARELEITLTGRANGANGGDERTPMCGVPHHSAEGYVLRLVEKGYKVAICEQTEEAGASKGIVRREIVRVVTPGTVMEQKGLQAKANNYLAAVVVREGVYGLSFCDLSTGEMLVVEHDSEQKMLDEMLRHQPAEIIVPFGEKQASYAVTLHDLLACVLTEGLEKTHGLARASEVLLGHYGVMTVDSFGLANRPLALSAAGMLIAYLDVTQKRNLHHLKMPAYITSDEYMTIDSFSRRNLELVETLRDKGKHGSLLGLLDETVTAMGGRLLRRYVERPLANKIRIEQRLDAVEELYKNLLLRDDIRQLLDAVYDLERLVARVSYGSANARDLLAIGSSLAVLPSLKGRLESAGAPLLLDLGQRIDHFDEIVELIERAIVEEPPTSVRDGGVIRDGFDDYLDTLKTASRDGKRWLAELEQQEREATGIKSLKVGFNKVFGYYIEVSKANIGNVPDTYERKQTLTNGERYVTPGLKEKEALILEAEEKMVDLEYQLFCQVRDAVSVILGKIQEAAEAIATIDVLQSLATVSIRRRYKRPVINTDDRLHLVEGRHPVVEAMLKGEPFVANDTLLNTSEHQIALITGPNMAGKSTYMRQVALIVILAQMGCFVPADHAEIGIVDRVFTRIGASDDLAGGQSTFMVEMVELANILHHATPRSLIILDEIGRGTSTFDGISIAQAVVEFLHQSPKVGAKTLFATHYHELTTFTESFAGVKHYSTHVQEQGDSIVFLRKILPQAADRSYGIQVAKLAGLPQEVLARAREILVDLEQGGHGTTTLSAGSEKSAPSSAPLTSTAPATDLVREAAVAYEAAPVAIAEKTPATVPAPSAQLSLFDVSEHPVVDELRKLDVMRLTPLDAMNLLYQLHQKARGE
ncbi:DNA mismatch repair protein MutS [Tumebacillus sp. ITR2]|uniref:DNA mismatch repair protein MutS n=1 Tax=Tumebacillus amylolyticus TaxID=2801339 RepID=A0ABS1JCH8_9BACL|nr:DNA mismatch repair protein MutS [Tumebacillus amylolyticus]MBL0387982.1 DNA mismatch repair protein MutS [Tumebacillus amylolyticus]